MTDYQTILFEKSDDKVATVTINRPDAFNSFNNQMMRDFKAVWDRIRVDDDIHAVVLRASPGRSFSPGADVRNRDGKHLMTYDNYFDQVDPGEYLGPKGARLWKPVVCAVHGMCAGGAFYWVNESDIVICSPDATFFDPHVTYGLVAACEPIGLRQRVPLGEVLRIALLGNDERMSAETALRISLVTEIVELENLWARAHELAAKIAQKPAVAVQGTVRAIWESLDMGRSTALHNALRYTQVGNDLALGPSQVDRNAVMAKAKSFEVR